MWRQNDANSIQTVDICFDVIEGLKELEGARVTELADHTNRSKSTVHNHLATLKRRGYVTNEGDEYHVGLRFANLGEYARYRSPSRRKLLQFTRSLPEFSGLHAGAIIEENGRGVYLKPNVEHMNPLQDPQVGGQVYLHTTAAGKAILASLPTEAVDAIVDRWGLPAVTEKTITDRETLFGELETVRERGYAFNRDEYVEGIQAIGTAVEDRNGTTLGGISVGGPEYRISDNWLENELPEQLLGHVAEFERGL